MRLHAGGALGGTTDVGKIRPAVDEGPVAVLADQLHLRVVYGIELQHAYAALPDLEPLAGQAEQDRIVHEEGAHRARAADLVADRDRVTDPEGAPAPVALRDHADGTGPGRV